MIKHYTESFVKQVLDERTGEVVPERYVKDTVFKANGKQGWVKMYKNGYDEVMLKLNSNLEMNLFIEIRDRFTRTQEEVHFSQKDMADKFSTRPQTVNKLVKKLSNVGFIAKVSRGVYRMNPYILVPYQADANKLQEEWDSLKKEENEDK